MPVLNLGHGVESGHGTSSFVFRLPEALRSVGRVELHALIVPPSPLAAYVMVSVPELGIDSMPVCYKSIHHPVAGNTYALDCNPRWHQHAPPTPIGQVSRLTVRITCPKSAPLSPGAITMLFLIKHNPRCELPLLISPRPACTTQLIMLDMARATRQATGDGYAFEVAMPDGPVHNIQLVRLCALRMPPLFLPPHTWEPYVDLELPELGAKWQVQHTWYYTNQDTVDWCVLPDHHCVWPQPLATVSRVSVRLASRIGSGEPHTVTAAETGGRLCCSVLLQLVSTRFLY